MPVYNTDVDMLKCVMESVINGSYDNYELCIYDASDENGRDATKICEDYAGKFPKIKYLKGDNFGIAENTNRCLTYRRADILPCLTMMMCFTGTHFVMSQWKPVKVRISYIRMK